MINCLQILKIVYISKLFLETLRLTLWTEWFVLEKHTRHACASGGSRLRGNDKRRLEEWRFQLSLESQYLTLTLRTERENDLFLENYTRHACASGVVGDIILSAGTLVNTDDLVLEFR